MLEGTFSRKLEHVLSARLTPLGGTVIKHANPYRKGVPDFSVTLGARTFWFEVKREGERPTKIQQWHLERMDGATLFFRQPGDLAMIWWRKRLTDWLRRDSELAEWIVERVTT